MSDASEKRSSVPRKVRQTLLDLGLRAPVPDDRHRARLRRQFGDVYEAFLEAHDAVAEGAPKSLLYQAKNANADLSLAIASQAFFPLHLGFLTWLVKEFPDPPATVLDLGCESGIVSLALARLWPDARIVGVDREPAAIGVAEEFASRTGTSNVAFHATEIRDGGLGDLGKFELVLGVAVFHEMLEEEGPDRSELNEGFSLGDGPVYDLGIADKLASLANLINEDGRLVVVNRWALPKETLRWVLGLEVAGWSTDFRRSYLLEVRDRHGEDEDLPITVHSLGASSGPSPVDDVLALHSYPAFRDAGHHFNLEGVAAEAIRRGLGEMERVFGYELRFLDGNGIERMELLASGPIAVLYHSSNRGLRRISVGTTSFIPEFAGLVLQYVESRKEFVEPEPLPTEGDPHRWERYGMAFVGV